MHLTSVCKHLPSNASAPQLPADIADHAGSAAEAESDGLYLPNLHYSGMWIRMKRLAARPGLIGTILLAVAFAVTALSKPPRHKSEIPFQDSVILIIRHAEKPEI